MCEIRGITQSQNCNNDINEHDDNMISASMWIGFFGGLF